jgi:hypothetical protein
MTGFPALLLDHPLLPCANANGDFTEASAFGPERTQGFADVL